MKGYILGIIMLKDIFHRYKFSRQIGDWTKINKKKSLEKKNENNFKKLVKLRAQTGLIFIFWRESLRFCSLSY